MSIIENSILFVFMAVFQSFLVLFGYYMAISYGLLTVDSIFQIFTGVVVLSWFFFSPTVLLVIRNKILLDSDTESSMVDL
jgi:hypothetical protein